MFIHDDNDEDDDDEVVTFFQRHSPPPFHRPLAASRVACCLFIFPRRRSPFDAANVSSSKQFFENTFAALKVAPFPPSTTKDGEKRGKTAVFLAKWKYRYEASVCMYSVCVYVCVCRRNSRMHATWHHGCTTRTRWKGRRVGLLSILPRVGGKKGAIVGVIVLDVVYRSLSRVYF